MPFNSGWRNDLLLDLPMTSELHNPTKGRTDNVGTAGGELHGVFGAGAAEPTKLSQRRGYSYDGGDHMQCSAGYSLTTGLVSAMICFSGAAPAAADGIFGLESGGTYAFLIYSLATDLRFYSGGGAPGNSAQVARVSWPVEQLCTFVGVYDGTNTLAYVNGQLAATATTPLAPVTNSLPLMVGARPGPANYYTGEIYHVGMADFACSPLMVQEYYLSMLQELNNI